MSEKFAFETDKVSIAFVLDSGLGDAIISRKVYDALIELAPDCRVDIFYARENHKIFAKAFYGHSENLNRVLPIDKRFGQLIPQYALSLNAPGYNYIVLYGVDGDKLSVAPKLFEAIVKVNEYNKRYVHRLGSFTLAIPLIHMNASKILNKNCYTFFACNGALPIRDDKVNIPLVDEYKPEFDALKLGNYITVYTDIHVADKDNPKVKCWPLRYWHEYVALLKRHLPALTTIQCGGGYDIEIENVDRNFLGCDLELTKYILANSLLHVGCEGGLVHLATALGTKCLVLFGPSDVHQYGFARNINLVSDVCSSCMYIFGDGGLRDCMRGAVEPPCMLSLTPRMICDVTCNYLNHLQRLINDA